MIYKIHIKTRVNLVRTRAARGKSPIAKRFASMEPGTVILLDGKPLEHWTNTEELLIVAVMLPDGVIHNVLPDQSAIAANAIASSIEGWGEIVGMYESVGEAFMPDIHRVIQEQIEGLI